MKRHFITTESGVRLCLHHVAAEEQRLGTVILAHGMFSNYGTCRGLAKHLAALNLECWILDSQGHGLSDQPVREPDFETLCLEDTEAVLAFVTGRSEGPVSWVGHSGGGLAILMYLARNPHHQSRLAGVVTIASQAFEAGFNWRRRLLFRACRVAIGIVGTVPGKLVRLGPENEFVRVMDQWLRWSVSQKWNGTDGFDYKAGMAAINLPVLSIAGVADKFIAPVAGCESLHKTLASWDKTFMRFGLKEGYLEDYSHARVVSSRNAAIDVWPVVSEWLLNRASVTAGD